MLNRSPRQRWLLLPLSLMMILWPSLSFAGRTVDDIEPIVISDDILKTTTQVESAISQGGGAGPSEGTQAGGDGSAATPSSGTQTSSAGGGKGNNGHGNNEDGVDSSNPGKGKGGPNGATDASCDGSGPCVDDENGKSSPANASGS